MHCRSMLIMDALKSTRSQVRPRISEDRSPVAAQNTTLGLCGFQILSASSWTFSVRKGTTATSTTAGRLIPTHGLAATTWSRTAALNMDARYPYVTLRVEGASVSAQSPTASWISARWMESRARFPEGGDDVVLELPGDLPLGGRALVALVFLPPLRIVGEENLAAPGNVGACSSPRARGGTTWTCC